jgi:hypothetical protein
LEHTERLGMTWSSYVWPLANTRTGGLAMRKERLLVACVLLATPIAFAACSSSANSDTTPPTFMSGNSGEPGVIGGTGDTGSSGNTGDSGNTGESGNTGNSGNSGSTGDTGDTGDSGDSGNS